MLGLQQGLAVHLETLINGALRLDPITQERLLALNGRVIALQPKGYTLLLYFRFSPRGIQVTTATESPPDLSIQANPATLLYVLNGAEVNPSDVDLQGDVQLARQLQAILAGLDLDWAEPFAKVFGDVAAQRLATVLRSGWDWGRDVQRSVLNASRDFLMYEQALVPTEQQVAEFIDAVDRLRDDYERLEVRVQRLQQRLHHVS